MTFSFCDMDYSESAVEKKKKVNKTGSLSTVVG